MTLVSSDQSTIPTQSAQKRLSIGDEFLPRRLSTLAGGSVTIPDGSQMVHLQLRRYAGCPICSLHLRSFARRKEELDAAGIREVAVFHSSADDLRKVHTELPFAVIPDPQRHLYDALGAETSARALLDPRTWTTAVRALASGAGSRLQAGIGDGQFGLPADFLISPTGVILARKYGIHADDQWSVDEVLALASPQSESV